MDCLLSSLLPELLAFVTLKEEAEIYQQFQGGAWKPNGQVLWSGVSREEAQRWADERSMQTLTTAMGPLMDTAHPSCQRKRKSVLGWKKYIKGASAVFAWCISKGDMVTVLTPPPPERFHPSGLTSFQAIEAPILKWSTARTICLRIEMVHPKVQGAMDFHYQLWPVDEIETWSARFRGVVPKKHTWRATAKDPKQLVVKRNIEDVKTINVWKTSSPKSPSRIALPAAMDKNKKHENAVKTRPISRDTKVAVQDAHMPGKAPSKARTVSKANINGKENIEPEVLSKAKGESQKVREERVEGKHQVVSTGQGRSYFAMSIGSWLVALFGALSPPHYRRAGPSRSP